jgi:hypothetical protein
MLNAPLTESQKKRELLALPPSGRAAPLWPPPDSRGFTVGVDGGDVIVFGNPRFVIRAQRI